MYARFGGEYFAWVDHRDDFAGGLALQAPAAPQASYFLNADDRGGSSPSTLPSFTVAEAAAQITFGGYSWNDGAINRSAVVTYSFRANAPATMPNGATGFSRFNTQQIAQTELVLQSWSDVANITFVREGGAGYSNSGQMLFANFSGGVEAAGFAYTPGTFFAESGDVWINSTLSYNSAPQLLNYGRLTLAHEIGHAIGLEHPDQQFGGVAGYYEDSRQYSVMSYWSETTTAADFQGDFAAAPLLDDIAAAQRLYGANMTTRTGNTTYGFNSNADRDYFLASSAATELIFAVWDAGGTDTLDFSGYSDAQHIELRQGYFSNIGGLVGNVTIAIGAVIEQAIGGSGVDTIIGNSAHNFLDGRGGNDLLNGGAGADTLNGGLGNDTYFVDNVGDQAIELAGEGTDRVYASVSHTLAANVENLTLTGTAAINGTGNSLANIITGNAAANVLNGGDGNDLLDGGTGNDSIAGGNGIDTVTYASATAAVTASLSLTTAQITGGSGTDTLSALENLTGSAYNDTLTGSTLANTLVGGAGNDALNGLDGNDVLDGGAGNDALTGGAGNDVFNGGIGSDTLNGGLGFDLFRFDTALSAVSNVDTINGFSTADDTIQLDDDIFTAIGALGTLAVSAFRTGTAAVDADDRIIYESATGRIYYDADGSGAGAQMLFAQVTAGLTLTNADFQIVG